jgi:hypothetical protein
MEYCLGAQKNYLAALDKLDVLAGHNIIGFDLPLLELSDEGIPFDSRNIFVYDIPDSHGTFSTELEAMIDEQFQEFT